MRQTPMSDDELIDWARANGWTIDPVSLFDDEGVEGWRVVAPDGKEWTAIGSWQGPPVIEDEAREKMAAALALVKGIPMTDAEAVDYVTRVAVAGLGRDLQHAERCGNEIIPARTDAVRALLAEHDRVRPLVDAAKAYAKAMRAQQAAMCGDASMLAALADTDATAHALLAAALALAAEGETGNANAAR
jgi:hypothetical protein